MTTIHRPLPGYLVDAVAGVGCLQDPSTLRQMVHRLGRDARSSLDGTLGISQRRLIVGLMEELCQQPAGLVRLVQSLALQEGNSTEIRDLKALTAAWEVDLLDEEEWKVLLELLDGVRVPRLHQRYSGFLLGQRRPPAPVSCSEPWAVFLHAATLNAHPGESLPCYEVLRQLLAPGAAGELQRRIFDWEEQHNPFRPAEAPVTAPSGKDPTPEDVGVWSPSDYLVIQLRPLLDAEPGSDVLLSHWRRIHPGNQLRGADRRIGLDDAEGEVRALIQQAESEWAYFLEGDLALEFLLPQELLDLRVERWQKTAFHGASALLGEEHHVVVRSLDRVGRRDMHGRWGQRWRAFAEGRAGRVHWFSEDGRSHLLSEPPPAVVVLSAPPGGSRGTPGALVELGEALRAGVPVVLWDGSGGDARPFRAALRTFLEGNDPRKLPVVVKALRIASVDRDPEEHVMASGHVALLWDDPTRMPVSSAGVSTVLPTGEEGPP